MASYCGVLSMYVGGCSSDFVVEVYVLVEEVVVSIVEVDENNRC